MCLNRCSASKSLWLPCHKFMTVSLNYIISHYAAIKSHLPPSSQKVSNHGGTYQRVIQTGLHFYLLPHTPLSLPHKGHNSALLFCNSQKQMLFLKLVKLVKVLFQSYVDKPFKNQLHYIKPLLRNP